MSTLAGGERGVSLSRAALQVCCVGLAFCLWHLPAIQPIKLMVVLLHEMSHGLMALASGGTVHQILITPDEGGACQSEGGNAALIAGAGYLGSMFFGGMILRAARGGAGVTVTYALLTLLVLGAAVTVLHDPYSRTFALALAGTSLFLGLLAPEFLGALCLRAVGTVSCLYAIVDIYGDLLASAPRTMGLENDAETFAALTGMPAQGVGISWLAVSVLFFLVILKASLQGQPEPARAAAAAGSSS
jgi:hypothetical protein